MPSSHHARPTAAAFVAALTCAALIVLGGCAAPSPSRDGAASPSASTPEATPADVRPEVGDCWAVDPSDAVPGGAAAPLTTTPVDCSDEHVTITAAVHDLPPEFVYPRVGEALASGELALVGELCEATIGADPLTRFWSRVDSYWFLPAAEAWEAGERWLRCDVAVVGLGPVTGPQLAPLPPTVEEVIAEMYGEYRRCVDTVHDSGPDYGPTVDWEQSTGVPCDEAQWELAEPYRFEWQEYTSDREFAYALMAYCEEQLAATPGRTQVMSEGYQWTPESRGPGIGACWMA